MILKTCFPSWKRWNWVLARLKRYERSSNPCASATARTTFSEDSPLALQTNHLLARSSAEVEDRDDQAPSSRPSATRSPSNPQPDPPQPTQPSSADAPPGAAARPLTLRFSDQVVATTSQ